MRTAVFELIVEIVKILVVALGYRSATTDTARPWLPFRVKVEKAYLYFALDKETC